MVTTRRKRATRAEMDARYDAIQEVVESSAMAQSCRMVFYRCTDRFPGIFAKSEKGYRDVQQALLHLRREERVPYQKVVDLSRAMYDYTGYSGLGDVEFVERVAALYRRDAWGPLGMHGELWVESRGAAATLQGTCRHLGVDLYPSGGFASESFLWAAVQKIIRLGGVSEVVIGHVGDYDDAGEQIGIDTYNRLNTMLDSEGWLEYGTLTFERIAVTKEQIEIYGLPSKPAKAGSRKASTTEVESMPVQVLSQLVTDFFEGYLPDGHLDALRVAEESERQQLHIIGASANLG